MRSLILRSRESFWFLPSVFGLIAVGLGLGLVALDHVLRTNGFIDANFADTISATGGRSILVIIGGSMLTVAGTSFSITISVLATTSSTYGPRLVRNFLADRANQLVLAVFTSTFIYTLVVLRAVRTPGDSGGGFVPVLSIHGAVLLGVADVAVLVFFIHHIADSVQITTLQNRVQADLVRAIDLVYPAEAKSSGLHRYSAPFTEAAEIRASSSGYVEDVDFERLVTLATQHQTTIEVIAMPGTHRIEGEVLAHVRTTRDVEAFGRSAAGAFSLGPARTPRQDVRFALQQLVEIGVRGLASGTNDPYTAVSALDLAAAGLVPLMTRPEAPSQIVDDGGEVRVVTHWPPIEVLLSDVFDTVDNYGMDHPLVIDAALHLVDRLSKASGETVRPELVAARARLERA